MIQEPIPVVATGSVEISPRGGPGPRIKHVCRNAAVVLGQPLATFPEKSELRLSALPTKDKVQLWRKDEESKAGLVFNYFYFVAMVTIIRHRYHLSLICHFVI